METIGIIAAMEVELKAIKEKVGNFQEKIIAKRSFFEGRVGEKKLVFVDCGVGKVNAAMTTQLLIDHFEVEAIINTGIAGGLDPSLKYMSVILGQEFRYHDFDSAIMKKFYPYKDHFNGDKELLAKMEKNFPDRDLRRGIIVTGDQFITSTKKRLQLREDFNATCVEMEGASIAHVCDANKIPFLGIRSISDFADDKGEEDYLKFEEAAASLVGEIVIKLMKEL